MQQSVAAARLPGKVGWLVAEAASGTQGCVPALVVRGSADDSEVLRAHDHETPFVLAILLESGLIRLVPQASNHAQRSLLVTDAMPKQH